jgi:hypothetical protein
VKDDIRYMSHEQRIREGFMAAPEIKRERKITVCFCGKTVTHSASGVKIADCPRECEKNRG